MARVASLIGVDGQDFDRHAGDGQSEVAKGQKVLSQGVAGVGWLLVLAAFVTAITLELARVLFSVGYHLADRVGWVFGGVLVIATFASPLLTPLWKRLAGAATLASAAAVLIGLRLAVQVVRPVPYWLPAIGLAVGLIALTVLMGATSSIRFGLAVVAGLAIDLALRFTGSTWDLPWRSGVSAWAWTALLVGATAVALAVVVARRIPFRDCGAASHLPGVLLGPLLYLACFYTASPAFIASSARLPLAVGAAVSLGDLALAAWIMVWAGAVRRSEPTTRADFYIVGGGVLMAVGGALLPGLTGLVVVPVIVGVQACAAFFYGRGLADQRAWRWWHADHVSLAAGALVFAGLALVYQISFLIKLPAPAWVVPAIAGGMFALAGTASPTRPQRCSEFGWVAAGILVLTALVPAASAASSPTLGFAEPGQRSVTVMTFNINQAVRNGQLDLAEISRLVRSANADVVVLEEVGRGMAVSGVTDEAEWLSRSLGLRYIWAAAGDNQLGNLVLTRYPVLEHKVINLGKGAGTQARSAALVRLGLGDGRDLLVIGTHLQNGSAPALHATREQEYRAILDQWRGSPRTVLVGDLNTYPAWPELQSLIDEGFHTTQNLSQCTMPTSNQNCPDWIFASTDLELLPVRVTADRPDHRPVIATVTLAGGGASQ